MRPQRPINLNLFSIRLPLPGIISILHRVSGVILFLFLPLLIWMLSESLGSQYSFDALKTCLESFGAKLLIWGILSALIYHVIAGVRHMIMDLGFCESLPCARAASYIVLIIALALIASLGVWLW